MSIETKVLIDMLNHKASCMNDYYKGRLKGRLETLKDFLEYIVGDEHSWKKVDQLEKEIKMIQDALCVTSEVKE